MADETQTEAGTLLVHRSPLSRSPQKSGRKTPIQRINSATAYRGFTVIMEIKLSYLSGPVSLEDYYNQHKEGLRNAITLALQKDTCGVVDPEVKTVSYQDETILVELLCRSRRSLLTVGEKLSESTTEINQQLRNIGINEEMEVTIVKREELDRKVKHTR